MAEPIAHGRTRLDRLESDSFSREFDRDGGKRVGALQIYVWRRGKVENDQSRRYWLGIDFVQDDVANVVDVEINETRFRPKNQHVRNQLVAEMPFAI